MQSLLTQNHAPNEIKSSKWRTWLLQANRMRHVKVMALVRKCAGGGPASGEPGAC